MVWILEIRLDESPPKLLGARCGISLLGFRVAGMPHQGFPFAHIAQNDLSVVGFLGY
jgi:hypothetical protein